MDPLPAASAGQRKLQGLLFAVTFLGFAYFHQGGGWNQNARFAMVRAIAEEGHFWIDSHLVYARDGTGPGARLVRVPVRDARFTLGGRSFAFGWRDEQGRPVRLDDAGGPESGGSPRPEATYVEPGQVAATGDLAFHGGHFHPAKAPGGAFVAIPAYFLLYHLERLAGADPDDWWVLTLNAWLSSVFSVGLLSALGCVLFYRLSLKLSDGRAVESLLATLAFAFGTMFFPYGTALYEHNAVAVALLASFYLLHRVKEAGTAPAPARPRARVRVLLVLAGLCAGYAAVANYLMALAVILLGGYLVGSVRWKGGWRWFGLGVLGPFLLLCAYNVACFSTPFTTNYRYEDPAFKAGRGALLDVFVRPQWDVLPAVLLSPFRGLFPGSPVLLLGVLGLVGWARGTRWRAEAWLMIAMVAFLLLFLTTFNGWHGGFAVGPRYLVPALPFLALPAVTGFVRWFRTACALGGLSVAITLLVTAVDPQAPVGIAPYASVPGRAQWTNSPLTEYELPLFLQGRAWPLLRAQRDVLLGAYDEALQAGGEPSSTRERRLAALAEAVDDAIRDGVPAPLQLARSGDGQLGLLRSELSSIVGPVSVNPVGCYEGWMYRAFPPRSPQARWNSFNAGELILGNTRASLLPLMAGVAALVFLAVRRGRRLDGYGSPSS